MGNFEKVATGWVGDFDPATGGGFSSGLPGIIKYLQIFCKEHLILQIYFYDIYHICNELLILIMELFKLNDKKYKGQEIKRSGKY